MANRILSIEFNQDHFPDSPQADAKIIELDSLVLRVPIAAGDVSSKLDPIYETGYVVCLPRDNNDAVRLVVSIIDTDLSVEFDVLNARDESLTTITMDTRSHFSQLDLFLNSTRSCKLDYHQEVSTKIGLMKMEFERIIVGNDEFWYRLQHDFSNAMAPLRKHEDTNDEQLVLKQVITTPPHLTNRAMYLDMPPVMQ